jgi:hypothetical protein
MRNMETSAHFLHSHFSDVLDITQYHSGKAPTQEKTLD